MNIASLSLRELTALSVSLAVIACADASPYSPESTTETTSVTEKLPDATDLSALEDASCLLSDSTSSAAVDAQGGATVPDFCTDDKLQRAFRVGRDLGQRWVRWLWHRYQCCDKVERFIDALMVLVERIDERAATEQGVARCRHTGLEEGALDEVDQIQLQCDAECYARGEAAGASAAKTYCELAIAAGGQLQPSEWQRQAVGFCGFAYQLGCDARFLGATASYVNDQGSCDPYTRDAYANIWDLSRLKACDYTERRSRNHRDHQR